MHHEPHEYDNRVSLVPALLAFIVLIAVFVGVAGVASKLDYNDAQRVQIEGR